MVVGPGRERRLIRGPATVWTYGRWKRVTVVDLKPFRVEVLDDNVVTNDGVTVSASGSAEAQVVDPLAAATRVVDYEQATRLILHTAIRGVVKELPGSPLREMTSDVESSVEQLVSEAASAWGVVVSALDLRLSSTDRRTGA